MLRLTSGREFGPADLDLLEDWARQGRVPRDGSLLATDDATSVRSVLDEPRLARILNAPPTVRTAVAVAPQAETGLIPYRNPAALTAYYLGIFSLMPLLGLVVAIPAFVLGIVGWRRCRRAPQIRGGVHAWVGILMGGLFTLVWGAAIIAFIVSMAAKGPGGAY